MRNKRARDIRKAVIKCVIEDGLDMRKIKGYYRRAKKDYIRGY